MFSLHSKRIEATNLTISTCTSPDFLRNKLLTSKQKKGLKYEEKALSYLNSKIKNLVIHQWFRFNYEGQDRYIQPDAYVVIENRLYIYEVKLGHTIRAFSQMHNTYAPILQRYLNMLPEATFYVEVASYAAHPTVKFQASLFPLQPETFYTHIYKKEK